MVDPKGGDNDRRLWSEANDGGRSLPTRLGPCPPCDCKELRAYLAEHPEADNPLIRWYISKQMGSAAEVRAAIEGGGRHGA